MSVNSFQMNQYVIACTATRQAVMIDCGASSQRELNVFLQWINDNSYELTAVWQTHAHLDHVAGLGLLRNQYPEIPIYLHPNERHVYNSFVQRCQAHGFEVEGGTQNFPLFETLSLWSNDKNDVQQLSPTTKMSLGDLTFDIIPVPGHSPGQVGFLETTYTKSFFGGDVIMQGSIGRTDLPESNPHDMQVSLKLIVETMHDDTTIYPGHGPPTLLRHEKITNPFLRPLVVEKKEPR